MLERLEEEDNAEHTSGQLTKKSRLCFEKVKALEKHFEVENKLQPERKLKIAEEVGLEPRQVAIWFQNRRARWRAKQLEREYGDLRASYDALKHDYGSLEQEKLALLAQVCVYGLWSIPNSLSSNLHTLYVLHYVDTLL